MGGDFRVIVDDEDMRRYLEGLDERGVAKILRKGVTHGAKPLKDAMKLEVPVKRRASAGAHGTYTVKRRASFVEKDYGTPGGMRDSVRIARIRRGGIGVVVAPMGKRAFMRHWIARGTKGHWIRPRGIGVLRLPFGMARAVYHPGIRNPVDYVGRAMARAEQAAVDRAERRIIDMATAARAVAGGEE